MSTSPTVSPTARHIIFVQLCCLFIIIFCYQVLFRLDTLDGVPCGYPQGLAQDGEHDDGEGEKS